MVQVQAWMELKIGTSAATSTDCLRLNEVEMGVFSMEQEVDKLKKLLATRFSLPEYISSPWQLQDVFGRKSIFLMFEVLKITCLGS